MSECGATVAGTKAQMGKCVTGEKAVEYYSEGRSGEQNTHALILALISSVKTVQTEAHSSNKTREGIRLEPMKTLVPAHLLCSTSGSIGLGPP